MLKYEPFFDSFVYESSGSRIAFANWKTDQPDNINGTEDCAAVINQNGQWIDENCSNITYNYICEEIKEVAYWETCQPGWDLINQKCYKFINKPVKYNAAHDMCRAIGGNLFEPRYETEEQLVSEFYDEQTFWIGVTDLLTEGR